VKKTNDFNKSLANKNDEKKNSLFEDSFFDDDEEDDDFDDDDDFNFDEDVNEIAEEETGKAEIEHLKQTAAPVEEVKPIQAAVNHSVQQNFPTFSAQQNMDVNIAQEIQFRLGCELGQILIPYENLQNLSIGSVVDFNNTLQTLYLSVNNVRVGEGMLVDVDGKIGIKITRWYGRV